MMNNPAINLRLAAVGGDRRSIARSLPCGTERKSINTRILVTRILCQTIYSVLFKVALQGRHPAA